MKKNPYTEGWAQSLLEIQCRAQRSADVFREMDINDINGTAVAPSVLDDIATKIEELMTCMNSSCPSKRTAEGG